MERAGGVRWLWLTLVVIVGDRALKGAIERETPEGFRREIIPNFASLVHSVNSGIAFGMLSESASKWISIALILSAAAIVALLCWLLAAGHAGTGASPAGFALIAGGAAGNLIDRLLHGGVTDFLELHAGKFFWPAFNLADSAITVGAVLVALELLRGQPRVNSART
jgi:signal peptidase II